MPCDQDRSVSVDLGNIGDLDALAEAMAAEGHTGVRRVGDTIRSDQGEFRSGSFRSFYGQPDVNALKRRYSEKVIEKQAKARGWTPKWSADRREVVLTKKKF